MPRVTPKENNGTAPRRVESSLLVIEQFKDPAGGEWKPGDRAPLARRAIREAVRARPELFMVEYETLPVTEADLDGWLAQVDTDYQQQYEQIKAVRDGAEQREQAALHAELEQQERGQPELERRFKKQEAERAKQEKALQEQRERRQIENQIEFQSGFHI
jgi:hypothetical protein